MKSSSITARLALALVLCAVTFATTVFDSRVACAADEPTARAVEKAHEFLKTESNGRYVLGFVHFGARYNGHSVVERRSVMNNGRTVPGHFALLYDFNWENDGATRLGFLCDEDGDVYGVQVIKTNAILSPPYSLAKLSISLLSELILEAFKDDISSADRKELQTFVRSADPESILELGLKLRQSLNVK